MKISNKELKKSYQLILQKNYTKAIRFLEPKIPLFMDNELFYYLLGYSCLMVGDLGSADIYLNRGRQISSDFTELKLLQAVVFLKKKKSEDAAKIWLAILDYEPDNKFALRGLEVLRKITNTGDYESQLNHSRMKRLFHYRINWKRIIFLTVILPFVLIVGIVTPLFLKYLKGNPNDQSLRSHDEGLVTQIDTHDYLDNSGEFRYLFTQQEALNEYQLLLDQFNNHDDNIAQLTANRIKYSNANQEIKAKSLIIEGHLEKPEYEEFNTNYTYAEVVKDPYLYENCWVLWTGKVSNLVINEDTIDFTLLVGYEEETVLEGIIPVVVRFGINLQSDIPIEILGRVIRRGNEIHLETEMVRHILPDSN